jgi:hypothetical protein
MRRKEVGWWVLVCAVAVGLLATACTPAVNGTWQNEAPVGRDISSWLTAADLIDCGTPTFCLALPFGGSEGYKPAPNYGELWDGTAWRQVRYPGGGIESLSCAGEWCLATTYPLKGADREVWSWAGGSWRQEASLPAPDNGVYSLSCVDSTYCVAIHGSSHRASVWDGARWTPLPDGSPGEKLLQVACAGREACFFTVFPTGDSLEHRVELWNGAGRTVAVPRAAAGESGWLACAPQGPCFYQRDRYHAPTTAILALARDGSGWSATGIDLDPGGINLRLDCAPDGSCTSVTDGWTATFDGTRWRVSGAGATGIRLGCASRTSCFYTRRNVDDEFRPVLERMLRWDGARWAPSPSVVDPPGSTASFTDVSCESILFCIATGRYGPAGSTRPLVEEWVWGTPAGVFKVEGEAPQAEVPGLAVTIDAVSCDYTSGCLGVGTSARGPYLAGRLHYGDNRLWTDDSASLGGTAVTELLDVDCTPQGCVIAALDGERRVVLLRQDGTGWQVLPASPLVSADGSPDGAARPRLSCASLDVCGVSTFDGASIWSGGRWSEPVRAGADARHVLTDISCPAVNRCAAVGAVSASPATGVITTWDGSRWTPAAAAGPLGAVSCATPQQCLALGGVADPRATPSAPTPNALTGGQVLMNGSWRAVGGAVPALPAGATVRALSCAVTNGRSPGSRTPAAGCLIVGASPSGPVATSFTFP